MQCVRLAGAYTFYNGNIRRLVPTFWWFLSQIAKPVGVRTTGRKRSPEIAARPRRLRFPTHTRCRAAPGDTMVRR